MKSVNTVTLLGHVTNVPELKTLSGGQTVCTFGLATNRTWKDKQGETQTLAEFHNLVVWGKLGEFCGQYVKKGKPLYVEGHLKTGNWEVEGSKHYKTEIVVDNVVLLGAKDKEAEASVEQEEVAVA
ncbi:MAG: single-stranded DNA-binding protein [Candidatus Peribacteraceae bacterium]|nr:single-stranded DNA-binding protein [Candidatus Peribacteraceae bacterium]